MFRSLFKKTYTRIEHLQSDQSVKSGAPEGMWRKCKKCNAAVYAEDVRNNHYICPKCEAYFRVHAYRRIEMLCDKDSFEEWNARMEISNPLDFPGYEEKIIENKEKTKLDEAVITGSAKIEGMKLVIAVCDARFMMSSMGHNVGEKITYAIERAAKEKLPLVIFSCSGGARMQEGIISLMQMAKTSAALKKLHQAKQVYISVLTDPTTGGVTASFAMLGDIILAEPKALIGFAGPRVIAQTIGAKLPEGFQRAEFLLEHGFVDAIVERKDQRDMIARILRAYRYQKAYESPEEREALSKKRSGKSKEKKTAWESVLISRSAERPTAKDYIEGIFSEFTQLHGDRCFADDGALIAGIGFLNESPFMLIGQQKGRNLKENKIRNFGMPSPEGYRKALRLMRSASDFGIPIICFVDTPGAFCGIEAEERGQGEAIARNLFEMSDLRVPVLSLIIGEGGSGGALAIAVSNEVWMLEHAIYSILSPEGFASILYKDAKKCKEAAQDMKITSEELLKLGIIEKIIPEDEPASMENLPKLIKRLEKEFGEWILRYQEMKEEDLVLQRYQRYRKY